MYRIGGIHVFYRAVNSNLTPTSAREKERKGSDKKIPRKQFAPGDIIPVKKGVLLFIKETRNNLFQHNSNITKCRRYHRQG